MSLIRVNGKPFDFDGSQESIKQLLATSRGRDKRQPYAQPTIVAPSPLWDTTNKPADEGSLQQGKTGLTLKGDEKISSSMGPVFYTANGSERGWGDLDTIDPPVKSPPVKEEANRGPLSIVAVRGVTTKTFRGENGEAIVKNFLQTSKVSVTKGGRITELRRGEDVEIPALPSQDKDKGKEDMVLPFDCLIEPTGEEEKLRIIEGYVYFLGSEESSKIEFDNSGYAIQDGDGDYAVESIDLTSDNWLISVAFTYEEESSVLDPPTGWHFDIRSANDDINFVDDKGRVAFYPIAHINKADAYVTQLHHGAIILKAPSGGLHWGEVEPITKVNADRSGSWEVDKTGENPTAVNESSIVDIDVGKDGKVTGVYYRTRTIDSNGNVVAISDRTDTPSEDPDEPDEPKDPDAPTCGNPLNDEGEDDSHPLDSGNANEGGGAGSGIDDSNPLDYEGEGGFTPTCNDE